MRQRVLAGVLGLGLGVAVPFAASVALVAGTGDPVFVIFPLPFLGLVWLIQGLAPAGYTLDGDALVLERRWRSRRLALDTVTGVDRQPRRVGGLGALGLNGLFGAHGARWNPWTGLHYLAIANTRDLVYLRTRRGLLVLSPTRPDEFAAEVEKRLARLRGRGAGIAPGDEEDER
jgi:hypothetical protein